MPRRVVILHNNARPHVAVVRQNCYGLSAGTFSNILLHSPGFPPCEYPILRPLKNDLKGRDLPIIMRLKLLLKIGSTPIQQAFSPTVSTISWASGSD
ncbi:hypothetical protein TNCV_1931501 [Trichonephila clavipes]|nr:hypothetical protein TNCV_1931501 [Trichonephila clavipes]